MMFCKTCRNQWPGHRTCPECQLPLVDLREVASQIAIDRLPLLEDLAEQYEIGKAEAAARESADQQPQE